MNVPGLLPGTPSGPPHDVKGSGRTFGSLVLAFRRRFLRNACPGPVARLASLHRRSPHGSREPAMALLEFRRPGRLRLHRRSHGHLLGPDRRPGPSPAAAFALPMSPVARSPSRSAMRDALSESSPAGRVPVARSPALVWLLRQALQCHLPSLRFRASFPGAKSTTCLEARRGDSRRVFPLGCSPSLPWVTVWSRPLLLRAFCVATRRPAAPGTLEFLAAAKLAGRFRLPTLLGFAT